MSGRVRVILVGDYPFEIRMETIAALEESMKQHAKAYGFLQVEVQTEAIYETTDKQ